MNASPAPAIRAFSDQNPAMAPVAKLAEQVRNSRKPINSDNPLLAMQQQFFRPDSRRARCVARGERKIAERTFLAIYGSPTLQAAVGVDPAGTQRLRKAPKNPCIASFCRNGSPNSNRLFRSAASAPLSSVVSSMPEWIERPSTSAASKWPAAFARSTATCRLRISRRWYVNNSTSC